MPKLCVSRIHNDIIAMRIDQELRRCPGKLQTHRPIPVPGPGIELPNLPLIREPGAGSREKLGCLTEATPTPAIELVVC